MQNQFCDGYSVGFGTFDEMRSYHEELSRESLWLRCAVRELRVMPVTSESAPWYGYAPCVSEDAVADTAQNLGLAVHVCGEAYPLRQTAWKSLLDRAKLSGSVLPKLSRKKLADILNECFKLHSSDALALVRCEKVSALHSGDEADYSVLPIGELLSTVSAKLNERFPGRVFISGYTDHALTGAEWTMPGQRDELLKTYEAMLTARGNGAMAARLMPGIRFMTSDTGVSSAKVSAMLMGAQYPIHIGGCVEVEHRHKSTVVDFELVMDQLFAQFTDSVAKLQKLLDIHLDYPVNAMTRVSKHLRLPKKAALEAISMFEMATGGASATAHDVFMALQEIPFILSTEHTPQGKLLVVEENLARALTLRWSDYDMAKAVSW